MGKILSFFLNKTFKIKILLYFIFLIFTLKTFAQTETILEHDYEKDFQKNRLSLNNPIFIWQQTDFNSIYNNTVLFQNNLNSSLKFDYNINPSGSFSFTPQKAEYHLANLGGYEHYQYNIEFKKNDRLSFNFGTGILKQSTIYGGPGPNFHFSSFALMKYSVTDWLSAYLYGQFISPSIGRVQNFFDPLIFSDPQFKQSEFGVGVNAGFKKMSVDFKVKRTINTPSQQKLPFSNQQSVISIGF